MLFSNVDEPAPNEIREWMKINSFSIKSASDALGISKRQFSRILSGEPKATRLHSLSMQMIWLINENKKKIVNKTLDKKLTKKSIKIPIK